MGIITCVYFSHNLSNFFTFASSIWEKWYYKPVFYIRGLIRNLTVYMKEHPDLDEYRIAANNYQIPSMINLYLKPKKEAVCLSINYHKTLYSFLYPLDSLRGGSLLFIWKGNLFPLIPSPYWNHVRFLTSFRSERNGVFIQECSPWILSNFKEN